MTSTLAVDIGNTDVKFGLFTAASLARHWRLEEWRNIAPEHLSESLKHALALADVPYEALIYSSVAPELDEVLRACVVESGLLSKDHFLDVNPSRWLSDDTFKLPVDFSLYSNGQLGTDRLVTTCAAALQYPKQPLLVINCGTATTFDLVNAQAVYQGGAIAPGWHVFSGILHEKTAKLPLLDFTDKAYEQVDLGLNTIACMEAGLAVGYRGLLLALIERSRAKMNVGNLKIISTGGLALELSTVCGLPELEENYHSTLLLEGLAGIYNG